MGNLDEYIPNSILQVDEQLAEKLEELKRLCVSYNSFKYNPDKWHFDMVTTFLICDKINLEEGQSFEQIPSMIRSCYDEAGIPKKYWHSMILSLQDGIFLYNSEINCYPIYHGEEQNIAFVPKNEDMPLNHIRAFFIFFYK